MLYMLMRLLGLRAPRRDRRPRAMRRTVRIVERAVIGVSTPAAALKFRAGQVICGKCFVVDGDTITIGGTPIRLAGIDAPELDQPWGNKAKFAMVALCRGQRIRAQVLGGDIHGRIVAKCSLPDGTDLSAALVMQGLALDWTKFSGGAYRHLEPAGVRKKLWRVEARHRGRLTVATK